MTSCSQIYIIMCTYFKCHYIKFQNHWRALQNDLKNWRTVSYTLYTPEGIILDKNHHMLPHTGRKKEIMKPSQRSCRKPKTTILKPWWQPSTQNQKVKPITPPQPTYHHLWLKPRPYSLAHGHYRTPQLHQLNKTTPKPEQEYLYSPKNWTSTPTQTLTPY